MKNLLVAIGLTLSTFCFAGTYDTIPANNTAIEYTGRIDFSNALAPKFSYSGVSIRACFSGTSIAVIMNDDQGQNYYNVFLDGKMLDTIRIAIGKKTYKLAEGLENKTHEIELFKRTELTFGKTQFFGFVVDKGATLSAITNKREKLIEFIGNSITCGYGNEGVNGGVFGPTTENHYMTYAAITARNFNARHMAVSRSGIGIYRNYDGPAAGSADCMTNLYTRTFLYDANPKYSFSEKPDLVCINLGTNDFSTNGGDSAKYVSNYFRLIDTIQKKYTMPDIVCLVGSMMSGTTLTNVKKYLKFVADSASKKGKGKVYFFEMSAQTGDLGIAIDYHPTVAQHKRNAQELTEFIKTIKGWKVSPSVLNANVIESQHIKIEFNTPIQDKVGQFAGIDVIGNGQTLTKSNAYLDTLKNNILHIITEQNIAVGDKLNLNYKPGTIESTDTVSLIAINSAVIENGLTETKIAKAATNTSGTSIILTFNKNVKKNAILEGFSVADSQGNVAIDSFKVSNTILTLFVIKKIVKGESLFVSYTGTNVYGFDGIALAGFTKMEVKNSSTFTGVSSSFKTSVEVYPNPCISGKFHYRIGQSLLSSDACYTVFDTKGSKIISQKLKNTEGNIDLDDKINNGVYIIKFKINNTEIAKTVVKE